MLASLLEFLRLELEGYIQLRAGTAAIKTKTCSVLDESGRIAIPEDTIAITLVSIEEDRTLKRSMPELVSRGGETTALEPEMRINVVIMFAAYFRQYDQALKSISWVLLFLQSHPAFRAEDYPRLAPPFTRITPEVLTLTFEQLNQIWGFLGGKQLPSVFCRVRTLTVRDTTPAHTERLVRTISTHVQAT